MSELRRKLYPIDSRMSRRVFFERLMRAVEVLDSDAARIPWYDSKTGKGDRRRVVNLTGLPHFPEANNAVVRVVVDLPPNSRPVRRSRITWAHGDCTLRRRIVRC